MRDVTTAFVLGAGLGTRLRPLTDRCPKPLLPVQGRPLITHVLDHLRTVGIRRVIVNTHHCPDAYRRAFPEGQWQGLPLVFRHEPVLLDTGGGLKNIEDLLDPAEPLLVYNGDILSTLPLAELLSFHARQGGEVEATLALRSAGPLRNVNLNAQGRVCDVRDVLGNPGVRRCQFAGIWIVEPPFLRRLERRPASIVTAWLEGIREKPGLVAGAILDGGLWYDVGSFEAYARIQTLLLFPEDPAGLRRRGPAAGHRRGGTDAAAKAETPQGLPLSAESGDLPSRNDGRMHTADARPDPEALALVRRVLALPEETVLQGVLVAQGPSQRTYWRVTAGEGRRILVMRYGAEREENRLFAGIGRFLREAGVPVPEILHHAPDRGLVVLEDLGNEDLWFHRSAPWLVRERLYRDALSSLCRLHAIPPAALARRGIPLMEGFGPALYLWERRYFLEQFAGRLCRVCFSNREAKHLEAELAALAARLDAGRQTLVHRDLQSKNVMVRAGRAVFIDFQGLRTGPPLYDVASLLYDPYVTFREEERTALLAHYYAAAEDPLPWEDVLLHFAEAAVQRLLQALGAFAYLGLACKRAEFLAHAPRGLEVLETVVEQRPRLPHLRETLRRCRASSRLASFFA